MTPSCLVLLRAAATAALVAVAAAAQAWTPAIAGPAPSARANAAAAADVFRGVTTLFGGVDAGGLRGDTWEWSGGGWQQRVTPIRPSSRRGHGMAFDARRQRVVLFGGVDASGPRADTWEWDGASWSLRSTAVAPTARASFGFAYDGARGVTVLFGGEGVGGALANDTWEWDGVAWSLRPLPAAPTARSAPAMAWDETRREVVLFGGSNSVQSLGDTWRWNGANWIPVPVGLAPAPRAAAAFAFDGNCGRGVLFGGRDVSAGSLFADAWEWTGATWSPLAGATPPARAGAAFVHDAQRGEHALFGGDGAGGSLADAWTLPAPCNRQMSLLAPLVLGANATFRYDYPALAGFQHYCWTLLTPPTPTPYPLLIPGFPSIGLARVDVFAILLDPQVFLDGSGAAITQVSVPNAPSLVGAGIDVQSVDFDFATLTLRWAANDLALTILPQTPVANFAALPPSGPAPLVVSFTNNSVGATSYLWDFGDGTTSALANPPPKTYVGGQYTVQLTATSASGASTAQQAIVVSGPSAPPVASFTVTPAAGVAPLAVTFTDTSTQQPTAWQWDFENDGIVDSTSPNPAWTYAQSGLYTVRLTASNALGSNTAVVANCVAVGGNQVVLLAEDFVNDLQMDADASAAAWGGGLAQFFAIGGDGRHGAFDVALCTDTLTTIDGKRVYTLSTDSTVIPATNTSTGSPIVVADGRFFFTTMVVPSDARIQFVGAQPAQVTVAGRLEVLGHIDASGASNTTVPLSSVIAGQPGGTGGPGAGSGGKGGDKITATQATTSGATATNRGVNGQDARVLVGQGYATTVLNTGGRGSTVFPASGLNSAIYYGSPTGVPYSPMAAAAGGGGGYQAPGMAGVVVSNNHPEPGLSNVATSSIVPPTATTITAAAAGTGNPVFPWYPNRYVGRTLDILSGTGAGQSRAIASNGGTNNATFTVTVAWSTTPDSSSVFRVVGGPAPLPFCIGPSTSASASLTLLPFPVGSAMPPSQHFLVGGSGGGGGASHACLSLGIGGTDRWAPGAGGGGGGGAISLRAGRLLGIAPAAKVLANGGSAANSTGTASGAQACVAGGGSGGAIVLQSGNLLQLSGGLIDVRGGVGGMFNRTAGVSAGAPPQGAAVQLRGGDGAYGYVRLEAPTAPPLTQLAGMQPAATTANLGALAEIDQLVATQSRFYAAVALVLPTFLRYEVHGFVDGLPFVLSDDPAVSSAPALPGAPVRAQFQAAALDVAGAITASGPWREAVRSTPGRPGIDGDGHRNVRFRLVADRSLGASITVDRVVIAYRN